MNIDPVILENGVKAAVEMLSVALPEIPPPVWVVLEAALPALVGYVATELEGGGDPHTALLEFALKSADSTADAAQTAKFG